MKKKLTEMTIKELAAYKKRWQEKRKDYQVGSKNHRKAQRRVTRATIQVEHKIKAGSTK